jgi:outer membrane protein OmpA-like peptidoglycan-associated protein
MMKMTNTRRSRRHRNPSGGEREQQPFFSPTPAQAKAEPQPFFQPKLAIGRPGDKYEQEADAVAEQVVNGQGQAPAVQQKEISAIQRTSLATPVEDEKLGTAEARMEKDKLVQEKPEVQRMEGEEEEPVQMMEGEEEEVQMMEEEEEPVQMMEGEEEEVQMQEEEEEPVQMMEGEEEEVQMQEEEEEPVQMMEGEEEEVQMQEEEEEPVQMMEGEEEEVQMQEEEEEPVQMMEGEEEEVQMMEGEEEEVQMQEGPLSPRLQRAMEEEVQMKAEAGGSTAGPQLSSRIQNAAGKGRPLPGKTRAEMESAFGVGFGGVNVHTDAGAVQMNKELGAQAFTHGRDVYFNSGKYRPESSEGKRLLAHELTHVVQQGGGGLQLGQNAVQKKKTEKTTSSNAMKRLGWAQNAIKHTKEVFEYGAGNQKDALESTMFNSYFRVKVVRDEKYWNLTSKVKPVAYSNWEAYTAAKVEIAKGGNCGEHAQVAFDYLRLNAIGETINMADKKGLDHAFVILGNVPSENDNQLAVADPWPTAPTATLWEDHFAYTADRSKLNLQNTTVADGKNLKAFILSGLTITDEGKKMLEKTKSAEETEKQIASGLGGWIWSHESAAESGKEFNYISSLEKVSFRTGTASLMSSSQKTIEKIANYLIQYPDLKLKIEGHTDSLGGKAYNRRLSEKRAKSCYLALIQLGIDAQRLSYMGHGKDKPIASNKTIEGRWQNRRVDFILITG